MTKNIDLILEEFIEILSILFGKIEKFTKYHKVKYGDLCSEIENGVSISKVFITVSGNTKMADLFIKNTYKWWLLDDKIDMDTTLLAILRMTELVTGNTISEKGEEWNDMYKNTSQVIKDDLWKSVQKLIPICIDITYLMRNPKFDKEKNKVCFTTSFPSGQHTLSISKMKSGWNM